jgi:hypothetical protein
MKLALLITATVAGLAAMAAHSAPSAPTPTVSCDRIIGRAASGQAGGYRVVLGAVSVPPAFLRQVIPTSEQPWTHWRKAGLVIRGNSLPVYVSVAKAWRGRAAITWGNSGTTSSLRIARCPPWEDKPWNAYAGGFLLRSRAACVPLVFQVGIQRATVRFGIGKRCARS